MIPITLTTLTWVVLAGCSASGATSAASRPAASPAQSGPGSRVATSGTGSPGNPLVLSCGQESFSDPPPPQQPQPGDLAIGPLYVVDGRRLSTVSPAAYSAHGSWKLPVVLAWGSTVTVEIAPRARGHVVISNPYSPVGGVVAATYRSCVGKAGFFAQSFTFLHGQTHGCVPLDVRVGSGRQILHATVSLAAGSCVP